MNKLSYLILMGLSLSGCTLSFQNIDTHGVASDVVDSEPKNDVQANPVLNIPVKPL